MSLGRLHYFDLRGRAEIIRLVCAYGRLPLDEVRIPMDRAFLERKSTLPFGQLPMMEIQGKSYAQSMAMARYAAKQCGLYPVDDDLAALEVDMVMDACADMMTPVICATFLERDPVQKERQLKKLLKVTLPSVLQGMDARIRTNSADRESSSSTGGPFFLGEQISVADIAVFDVLTNALMPKKQELPIDLDNAYPKLMHLVQQVRQVPAIAEYLQVRNTQETKF